MDIRSFHKFHTQSASMCVLIKIHIRGRSVQLYIWCTQFRGWTDGSPLDRVLEESLHFWEWRDNADVQSLQLVFTVWIPPESRRKRLGDKGKEKRKRRLDNSAIIISPTLYPVQVRTKQQKNSAQIRLVFLYSVWLLLTASFSSRTSIPVKQFCYVFNLPLSLEDLFIFHLSGYFFCPGTFILISKQSIRAVLCCPPVTFSALRSTDAAALCSPCLRWSQHRPPLSNTDPVQSLLFSEQTLLCHPTVFLWGKKSQHHQDIL